jgi:hypothetical protein
MNTFWQAPAVLVVFVTWFTAPPNGFADIARRESLRRQMTSTSVKSFTNLDLPPVPDTIILDPATSAAGSTGEEVQPPINLGGEVAVTTGAGAGTAASGAPAASGAGSVTRPGPVEAEDARTQPASATTAEQSGAAPARAGRGDEKQWRDRMAGARQALERDQLLLAAIQSRINSLNTDIVNRDDPAQQAELRQQLQRVQAEQQRLQTQVAADQKAIDAIVLEARRAGVPPGWIR